MKVTLTDFQNTNEVRNILKQKNIKVTLPRIVIFQILQQAKNGLSAYDIETILINSVNHRINLTTIYLTLKMFYNTGLIQRYKVDSDRAIYILSKSATNINLECKNCGAVSLIKNEEIENKIKELCLIFQPDTQTYNLTICMEYCTECEKLS